MKNCQILMFMIIVQSGLVNAMEKTDAMEKYDWKKELVILFQMSSIVKADPEAFENYVDTYCICLKEHVGKKAFYEQIAQYKCDKQSDYDEPHLIELRKNNLFAELLATGNKKGIALLTQDGANVNKSITINRLLDNGKIFCKNWTPLNFALHNYYYDIVENLIEAGADVNAYDSEGGSPLHFAVNYNPHLDRCHAVPYHDVDYASPYTKSVLRVNLAQKLIAKGARIEAKNLKGKSPENNLSEDLTQLEALEDTNVLMHQNISMQKSKKLSLGKVEKLPFTADEKWFDNDIS